MPASMVLYRIDDYEHGIDFVRRTEKEVTERAKEIMTEFREVESVDIYKCRTVELSKDNILAIIVNNGGNWCANEELIRTIYRK